MATQLQRKLYCANCGYDLSNSPTLIGNQQAIICPECGLSATRFIKQSRRWKIHAALFGLPVFALVSVSGFSNKDKFGMPTSNTNVLIFAMVCVLFAAHLGGWWSASMDWGLGVGKRLAVCLVCAALTGFFAIGCTLLFLLCI